MSSAVINIAGIVVGFAAAFAVQAINAREDRRYRAEYDANIESIRIAVAHHGLGATPERHDDIAA